MRIMVIAAHPDDEILGVGGTVKKHADAGNEVYGLILGEGLAARGKEADFSSIKKLQEDALKASKIIGYKRLFFSKFPDNRFDSVDLLDIIKEIEKYIEKIKPKIIYTHHYGDLNIDHRMTFEAAITATRPLEGCSVKEVYSFETPSSTEWNFKYGRDAFCPNVFVDITQSIEAKLEAMKCYKTEIRKYPHPRSLEALRVIAKRWGTVVNIKYAEAFELIRKII